MISIQSYRGSYFSMKPSFEFCNFWICTKAAQISGQLRATDAAPEAALLEHEELEAVMETETETDRE